MIGKVELARSGLVTSRVGFGTSRLHHVDKRTRARLLEMAVDLGLIHFDTAPLYGDTLAEQEIGAVLGARRGDLIFASKYGLAPDGLIAAVPQLALPVKAARAVARKLGLAPRRSPLTAEGVRDSVEQSLRRLRTDYLDILLLHEPTREVLADPWDMHDALLALRTRGLIRHFGLAGGWGSIAGLGDAAEMLGEVVQTNEQEWPEARPPDIAYGAMGLGPQTRQGSTLETGRAINRLGAALRRRPGGVVLVSTTSPDRLRQLADAASEVVA